MSAIREGNERFSVVPRRLWPLGLGVVALASLSGCSWIFVQPLPAEHGYGYQPCTTSRVAPVLDTLFTITNLASALYVGTRDNVTNKGTAVSVGIGVATLWALSAGYGYSNTAECEEAHEYDGGGYRAPPHLRRPPRYYPPPQAGPVDPAAAPAVAPPEPGAAPQRGDDDEPADHRAPEPNLRPAPPTTRERLDAPRFGG